MSDRYARMFARLDKAGEGAFGAFVMLGDPTLYTRTDAVESAWRFCGTILDAWGRPGAPPPLPYVAGSWGPDAADDPMTVFNITDHVRENVQQMVYDTLLRRGPAFF